jgi:hypothetical protein
MGSSLDSSSHAVHIPAVVSQSGSATASTPSYNELVELSVGLWVDKIWGKLDEHDVQIILEYGPRKIHELHNSIEATGVQSTATLHGSLSRLTQEERKNVIGRAFDSRRTQYRSSPSRSNYVGRSSQLPDAGSAVTRDGFTTPKKRKWHGNSSPSTCGSKSTTTSASWSSPVTTPSSFDKRHNLAHSTNKRLKAASACTSTSGRKEYYCGICNKHRNHKPIQHMRDHLVQICPSLCIERTDSLDRSNAVDYEDLLLGCGYCKSSGTTEKYFGDAFLGLPLLVQHVLEKHCTQCEPLIWDTSVAINNVLTSKVFGESFENLKRQRYQNWTSVPLSWRQGSNADALLHTLEKIGGCSMDANQNIHPLDESSRIELAKVLDAACVPILDPSVAPCPQDGTTTSMTYTPNPHTQPHIRSLSSSYDQFVFDDDQADPFIVDRTDTFASISETQPMPIRQPTETMQGYDGSIDSMFSIDG